MDTDTARTRLEGMLADLDATADTLQAENPGDTSELSSYDQHPADHATELSDLERENAQLDVVAEQRAQVRAALQRVEDGSYGRCVDCGQPIPDERLDARPEAARCVADQAKVEMSP